MKRQLPLARTDVIVKDVDNETVIYDATRSKAFCLNQTSATVWKHCDGNTNVSEMTQALRKIDSSMSDDVVWVALQQFESDGLLERSSPMPADAARITRKELIRKLGIAAALAPLVATLVAPTPAKAQSGTF